MSYHKPNRTAFNTANTNMNESAYADNLISFRHWRQYEAHVYTEH